MYGLVWNRVVLLAAGIAFGWNLVHYWTTPLEQVKRYRLRLAVAAAAGLGLALWLGSRSITTGVSGLVVFGFSALTAYAANARQKNRSPAGDVTGAPQRPESFRDGALVLLIAVGEPPGYTGPEPWAKWLAQPEIANRIKSSWFSRPLLFRRIRAVYERMGSGPLIAALQSVADDVGARLASGYTVVPWILSLPTDLGRQLRGWAEEGHRRFVIVRLCPASHEDQTLQETVVRSRVREIGARVDIITFGARRWPESDLSGRILQVMRGQIVAAPPAPSSSQLDHLAEAIRSTE